MALILGTFVALSCVTLTVVAQAVKGGNPKAAAIQNPVKPTPDSIRKGLQAYQKSCRHCHGVKGLGDGPLAENPNSCGLTDDTGYVQPAGELL